MGLGASLAWPTNKNRISPSPRQEKQKRRGDQRSIYDERLHRMLLTSSGETFQTTVPLPGYNSDILRYLNDDPVKLANPRALAKVIVDTNLCPRVARDVAVNLNTWKIWSNYDNNEKVQCYVFHDLGKDESGK
jgi:hypothetical protein